MELALYTTANSTIWNQQQFLLFVNYMWNEAWNPPKMLFFVVNFVEWSLKSTAIPNIWKQPVYGMKFEIHNKFYFLQTMWNEAWNPQQILLFVNYVKWSLKFTEIPIIWKSTTNSTICKLHGMKS